MNSEHTHFLFLPLRSVHPYSRWRMLGNWGEGGAPAHFYVAIRLSDSINRAEMGTKFKHIDFHSFPFFFSLLFFSVIILRVSYLFLFASISFVNFFRYRIFMAEENVYNKSALAFDHIKMTRTALRLAKKESLSFTGSIARGGREWIETAANTAIPMT